MPPLPPSTGLTITNPLVLYRSLVATKRLEPDPSQHRLAIHLRKLYQRLKDYQPEVDFGYRLRQINGFGQNTPAVASNLNIEEKGDADQSGHSIWTKWRRGQEDAKVTALARRLTDRESAIELQSPKGLLLYGEVGTGKSLLVDLLADCLPNQKKRRWHFNTFMLETFAKLEALRKESLRLPGSTAVESEEHSLVRISRDMVAASPLLFLDEFQMPDRTSSRILSNLFTSFFHLGGVLIATSNRMPEELANAAGVEFTAPPASRSSLRGSKWGLLRKGSLLRSENMFSGKSDFAAFLEVLKARCEVWEMEGAKDWRRRETDREALEKEKVRLNTLSETSEGYEGLEPLRPGNLGLGYEQSLHVNPLDGDGRSQTSTISTSTVPKYYIVRPAVVADPHKTTSIENEWRQLEASAFCLSGIADNALDNAEVTWESTNLRVYGRDLLVPRCKMGVTKWAFNELCGRSLGPADYISLASTFHTLILTDMPVLSYLQKNEARRLITLLDALYEAKCKLLISAQAGPDDVFFPTTSPLSSDIDKSNETGGSSRNVDDSVYPETFSEIYQDQTSPFRPNISSYSSSASPPAYASNPGPSSASQLSAARSILADEDSDFGPVYSASRGSDVSDGHVNSRQAGPDFARTGAYTGEDEKFAYKRASSRLWEMCGARWWAREGDWWKPLEKDIRRWETSGTDTAGVDSGLKTGHSSFRHTASPFRTSEEPPPRLSWAHAWGMMTWGKKAGAWGKGPAGLSERKGNVRNTGESKD